jgi:hypothetical protein
LPEVVATSSQYNIKETQTPIIDSRDIFYFTLAKGDIKYVTTDENWYITSISMNVTVTAAKPDPLVTLRFHDAEAIRDILAVDKYTSYATQNFLTPLKIKDGSIFMLATNADSCKTTISGYKVKKIIDNS